MTLTGTLTTTFMNILLKDNVMPEPLRVMPEPLRVMLQAASLV